MGQRGRLDRLSMKGIQTSDGGCGPSPPGRARLEAELHSWCFDVPQLILSLLGQEGRGWIWQSPIPTKVAKADGLGFQLHRQLLSLAACF